MNKLDNDKLLNALGQNMAVCLCHGDNWQLSWQSEELKKNWQIKSQKTVNITLKKFLSANNYIAEQQKIENCSPGDLTEYKYGDTVVSIVWHWLNDSQHDRIICFHPKSTRPSPANNLAWQELETLFDSMHDGIWVIDGQGFTVRVNKAMERIAGVRSEDVVGKHVMDAVRKGLTSSWVTLRALKQKKALTMFDDYGNGVRCLNTSTPILDENGEPWRVIACIRDISELETLEVKLNKAEMEAELYRSQVRKLGGGDGSFIGVSLAMQQLDKDVNRSAYVNASVLLSGETGTGKTMAAKIIHERGKNNKEPFITLNCGAIPAELLEAELFGYESGAFSGASPKGKPGLFELASNGTLFLDEVAELPLHMQVKLLHVLDGVGYRRLGGTKLYLPKSRIIAATNKDIQQLIKKGQFREDLYYRLKVLVVNIPPLRERMEDVPYFISYFLEVANGKYGLHKTMSPNVIDALMTNPWRGNVRELRATIELLVAMSEKKQIQISDLPHMKGEEVLPTQTSATGLKKAIEELETRMISMALLKGGSTYKAAHILGVSQSTIARKARKYHLLCGNENGK